MFRTSLILLIISTMTAPSLLFAGNNLEVLEKVVAVKEQVQPGLRNYMVTVETSRIEEMMANLTSGIPADVEPPLTPVITKFWQRNGKGLVYTEQPQLTPYVDKMVQQISTKLAIDLNELLLPAARTEQRRNLVKDAEIKSSEVALADSLIHHLEIVFAKPTDLDEAFYLSGMRLPQKQINSLVFDVDIRTNTVSEMDLVTDNGLRLTVEIRYLAVADGYIPERFQITSPDGKIDDLFQVKFSEVDGYILPTSVLRVIRRPELQENLEIHFKDYQINQQIPVDIQARLDSM